MIYLLRFHDIILLSEDPCFSRKGASSSSPYKNQKHNTFQQDPSTNVRIFKGLSVLAGERSTVWQERQKRV